MFVVCNLAGGLDDLQESLQPSIVDVAEKKAFGIRLSMMRGARQFWQAVLITMRHILRRLWFAITEVVLKKNVFVKVSFVYHAAASVFDTDPERCDIRW